MAMNIPCNFEKASYNILFVRAVMVKSLYTLWQWQQRRNKAKSLVSIISDAYTPQPGEIFFNTMRYTSSEQYTDWDTFRALHVKIKY